MDDLRVLRGLEFVAMFAVAWVFAHWLISKRPTFGFLVFSFFAVTFVTMVTGFLAAGLLTTAIGIPNSFGEAVIQAMRGLLIGLLFGGWSLIKTYRSIRSARKGFRWSLYFVHKRDGLRYALHENAVGVLLGYVLAKFENGKRPRSEWDLYANFNWEHKAIKLEDRYFEVEDISPELWKKIEGIDPGWMVKAGQPIFEDARTRKQLPLGWANDVVFQRPEERLKVIQKRIDASLNDEEFEGPTFSSVMDEVFQKEGS